MRKTLAHFFVLIVTLTVTVISTTESALANSYGSAKNVSLGIYVEVSGPYNTTPESGFLPIRVEINNQSTKKRKWSFSSSSDWSYKNESTYSYLETLTVPAGEQRVFEIFVPLALPTQTYAYSNIVKLNLSGYGIKPIHYQLNSTSSGYGLKSLPSIAISDALALRSYSVIKQSLETIKYGFPAVQAKTSLLPSSWKGYSGFQGFWISAKEWRGLTANTKSALLEWTMSGGQLYLFANEPRSLPAADVYRFKLSTDSIDWWQQSVPYGLGTVHLRRWDSQEIDVEHAKNMLFAQEHLKKLTGINEQYRTEWKLWKDIPPVNIPRALVGLLLLIYAILIGPVNLFVIAKKQTRHLLFFSTPVISLLISGILVALTIFVDGFGGFGFRTSAIYLSPTHNNAAIYQEQISRTGVLLKSSFRTEYEPMIAQLTPKIQKKGSRRYQYLGPKSFRSDWFDSRQIQGQYISYIKPTRARLELFRDPSGNSRNVISSIDTRLSYLFVVDDNKQCFEGRNVDVGKATNLKRVRCDGSKRPVNSSFDSGWIAPSSKLQRLKEYNIDLGPRIKTALDAVAREPGFFFAVAEDDAKFALPSLPTLKWKRNNAIFFGNIKSTQKVIHE